MYNEYNQLAFVVPPLAAATALPDPTTLDNLCYQYRYDSRNRLVEKKLPGKDWEYMVYDLQDRLVATQDANMRSKGQWLFTKYNQLGRVVFTGIHSAGSRASEQALAHAKGSNNESRTSSVGFTQSGMSVYYTKHSAYPDTMVNLLSVNYYDEYPAQAPHVGAKIQNQDLLTSAGATITSNGYSSFRMYPTPRTVWISFCPESESSFFRR